MQAASSFDSFLPSKAAQTKQEATWHLSSKIGGLPRILKVDAASTGSSDLTRPMDCYFPPLDGPCAFGFPCLGATNAGSSGTPRRGNKDAAPNQGLARPQSQQLDPRAAESPWWRVGGCSPAPLERSLPVSPRRSRLSANLDVELGLEEAVVLGKVFSPCLGILVPLIAEESYPGVLGSPLGSWTTS